ncbi:hypothetical protein D3C87_2013800 [compost metagenome]
MLVHRAQINPASLFDHGFVEILAQRRQGHAAKTRHQQGFGVFKSAVQRLVYRGLYQAAG